MKLSIVHRLVRHIATYHFLSCFVIFLVVEVNGVSGRSDLRTKLLLQNIRSHLAQKVDEIVHLKECESGLTLCKNIKNKEEGDEEKSEEIPPPPKIARGAHKPLIKVSPKDVIQTLMPKAHKRKVQKEVDGERHKKFLFSHLEVKPSEESEEEDTSEPIQEPEPLKTPELLKTPKPVKVSTDKKDKPIESPIIKPQKPVKVELNGTTTPRETEKKPQIVKIEEKKSKTVKIEEKKAKNAEIEEKKPKIVKIEGKKEKEMKDEKPMVKKKMEKIESEKEEDGRGDASLVVFGDVFIYALDSAEVKDKLCRKHSQIYQKQLKKNKIWALMMYDASAKLPSGILQGNVNQYGDFDECLSINAVFKDAKTKSNEPSGIKGKYCLANVDLSTNQDDGAVLQALERAESFNFIKSTIYDPGHFIPRFSSINWGLCVPSACPAEDVERFMKSRLEVFNKTSGLLIDVHVEEDNCVVKDDLKPDIHLPLLMTILFYFIIISMSLCATYMDRKEKGETEEKRIEQELQEAAKDITEDIPASDTVSPQGKIKSIMMAFSLKRTLEKLLSDNSSGNIDCINGIKSIFTVVLYFAHKTIQLGMSPYTNRILLTKISNEPATVPLRTSIIYTDSFLLISGVLTSYNLSKEISEKGKISWVRKSIARFIRLTPALLAVVLFYAYVWDHLGSGPTWNLIVRKNSELCQKFMWRNLMYIQNFFAFENMCAPQTHQLALDMQLSTLSPLFVYLLHTYDKVGIGILQALFLVSSIIRYITASNNNLSVVIYHGMSVSQLYRTANLLYGQSLHRASPYILGTIVGYYLKRFEKTFQMPKAIAALGWIIAFSLGFYSVISPSHMAHRGYQYDVQEAAQYAALSPVAWALALSWLIAACHLGYGGKLNEFLCQRIFLVFSRISYSVYLTQFLVFFYKIGVKRVPEMFSFTGSVNITEFLIVIAISVIVTLLFDIPMMEVKRIILDKKHPTQKEEKEAVENEETREPEQRPPLQKEYEFYSRGDLQDEINTIREEVIEEEQEQEEEGEQEQEHEGEQEEEELEDEEEEEEVEEGDEEDTGEVGSEEDEAEESEEMEEEEDDLESQPLRRSTTFHFDEPED